MAKLLIVDDEEDIREFTKSFFKKRGVEVLTSPGGVNALLLVERENPDLILLDVTMDEMSGIDILKRIRETKNDVKVIMVTGLEDETIVNEANSWGIVGFVHKPLILEELEKIVMRELRESR